MFATNLQRAIDFKGTTSGVVAARCGIPQHEFDLYVNGIVEPDAQRLEAISNNLGMSVKELAGDDELTFTSFGSELRKLREEAGLTLSELQELTGVYAATISKYELGKTKTPTKESIDKIADVLGDGFMKIVERYIPEAMTSMRKKNPTVLTPAKTDEERKSALAYGAGVRASREELGMSRETLSEKLGVSKSTIYRIEHEGYVPTDEFRQKLEAIISVTPIEAEEPKPKAEFGFKKEWFALLDYLDDADFRKATTALLNNLIDGTDIPDVGSPEANLILRMIKGKGVA